MYDILSKIKPQSPILSPQEIEDAKQKEIKAIHRPSAKITDNNKKPSGNKVVLDNFKIMKLLGKGSFGRVSENENKC